MMFETNTEGAMYDRIDAFLDDELTVEEREQLLLDAQEDSALAAELARAQALRSAFRGLDGVTAPPDMAPAVLDRVRRASLLENRPPVRRRPPVFRGVVAVAMIVVAVLLIVPGEVPRDQEVYTDQEIAQALEDVQWAFSIVSQVGERTGRIVRDEALVGRTIEPVRSALEGVVSPSESQQ
jgi:anti-sigma factor RsiW